MKTIKINTTKANLPLSQREYDRIVNDKNTINLSNRLTTKQIKQKRIERAQKTQAKHILKWLLLPFITLLVLVIANGIWTSVHANYNDELKYYNVDNGRDLARAKRIEVCERVWKSMLWEVTQEQINHCATMNTIITAIESGNMKSNRCMNYNNCKWLKGWQNGKYGFMKFNSLYEQNIYFTEKWYKFHYKKSIHTLIYWYRQKDWNYKYWWTSTQRDIYYSFVRSKYYKVLNEIKSL